MLLEPGASQRVEIVVDPSAHNYPLSVWSYEARRFVAPAGEFQVHVGTSSVDTIVAGSFTVERV